MKKVKKVKIKKKKEKSKIPKITKTKKIVKLKKIHRKEALTLPASLPKITKKPKLKPIKKIGKWCNCYPGRLPFPIECSNNKSSPYEVIFTNGKKKIVKNFPDCPTCKRDIKWTDWKEGKWDKVKLEIKKGADLRNQPSPCLEKNLKIY
jgi:hypothetical protein